MPQKRRNANYMCVKRETCGCLGQEQGLTGLVEDTGETDERSPQAKQIRPVDKRRIRQLHIWWGNRCKESSGQAERKTASEMHVAPQISQWLNLAVPGCTLLYLAISSSTWMYLDISCIRKAFNKSHPAFAELSTKVILLSQSFQRKPSCFRRAFNESHLAFVELLTKAILLSQSF